MLNSASLQVVIRQAVREGLLPNTLDAVICEMPAATFIVRGRHLHRWLSGVAFVHLPLACSLRQAWGSELDHDYRLG